jgi:hypothetical protein
MHELYVLLNVSQCILCFLLQTECKLCFLSETECRCLSNSDGWADISLPVTTVTPSSDERDDVSTPVATVFHSSDGRMISSHLSLLGITVATDDLCPSLLYYHYNDIVVATDKIPMATITYNLFLQWCALSSAWTLSDAYMFPWPFLQLEWTLSLKPVVLFI